MRLFFSLCFAMVTTFNTAYAAFVTPNMGGGQVSQGLVSMKHADIGFSNNALSVHVDPTVGIPRLRPLEAPNEFDPVQPWSVLGTKAHNFQYGWNPIGFISLPANAWIWIEQLWATPGLETYQRPPASPAYNPIFGTEGSSTRWRWSVAMTHNVYAVQDPILDLYEANYRVYLGNDVTGEPLPAYASANVTFQFSATPDLLADFDDDDDVDSQDLAIWEQNYGTTGTSEADADGDGDSDGADFLIWQREMSSDFSSTFSTSIAAQTIPEPTSVGLLISAVLCALGSRRRVEARLQ